MPTPTDDQTSDHPSSETEEEGETESVVTARSPSFPMGRVKRILRLERDIRKVNSEALYLISLSAELFTESLAEKASNAAALKRRKTVKLEHLRTAIHGHSPTADFLLDCLPKQPKSQPTSSTRKGDMEGNANGRAPD
ncbi:hypothetical protein HPP92_002502 [Vanilla planifolia]|uniref:Transcription factor CBF/NF-Y/archaeal histone domain-containing protein n=1 Tax=Vanilla planifolia TaxID=51239 RepID=A0A835S1B5_VANPL|nr:hypothetical protein HPP92_002502 [Vanilla planifolia]